MASPSSEVDICNLALQRLGAKAISGLNEDSTAGRECNRVYAHARDSEIRAYEWNFARTRAELAASTTSPAFGFANSFPLPVDYLRLLSDTVEPNPEVDWQIEGRNILTDDSAPLQIVYLKRVTDPNDFDDLFLDLLVARIAVDIVEKITQSNTKAQLARETYRVATATARRIDSFESVAKEAPTDTWITARI